MSVVAHFFMSVGGSEIHERLAHFFIDIYSIWRLLLRMPPLLADFIHNRVCELKCEKFLTRPNMKADYEQKTASLTDILARLTAERDELANGVNNEHPALVAFMKYQNISTLTREILIELVDHIKVYDNGNISVKFKFADELRKIAEFIRLNTVSQPEAI